MYSIINYILFSITSDYDQIINDGFTGFIITSSDASQISKFSGIPNNVGLLISRNYHYYMILERIWNHYDIDDDEPCIECFNYRKYPLEEMTSQSISEEMRNFIESLKGAERKVLYYNEETNKLFVAYRDESCKRFPYPKSYIFIQHI